MHVDLPGSISCSRRGESKLSGPWVSHITIIATETTFFLQGYQGFLQSLKYVKINRRIRESDYSPSLF
jgi:hypothetical protein